MQKRLNFSVLLSLYARENPVYLDACLKSLSEQTLWADEIVLVLDGPVGDPLMNVIQRWTAVLPLKLVPLETNIGLGRALNIGLSFCSHELVLRMDTDDICHRDRFSRQVSYMSENPNVALLGSAIEEIDPNTEEILGVRRVPCSWQEIKRTSRFRNPFNHMTAAYRKSVVESVGGYQHLLYMEDYSLWLRVLSRGFVCENSVDCLVRARTGINMLQRRRGWTYVVSEFELYKLKISLKTTGIVSGFIVFVVRSIPRLLPASWLALSYKIIRSI